MGKLIRLNAKFDLSGSVGIGSVGRTRFRRIAKAL